MDKGGRCGVEHVLEELLAVSAPSAGLMDECLSQGVVASDEVLVAAVEAGYVAAVGCGMELAARSSVAVGAGEHEVPNPVEVGGEPTSSQDVGENVVHVRQVRSAGSRPDVSVAVEAAALLVAVQGVPRDNRTSTVLPALSEAGEADMEAFLADMRLIYPVLGVNAFESTDDAPTPAERLYLTSKSARAEGHETSDGFVVFEGALVRADSVPSIGAYGSDLRHKLTTAGLLTPDGDQLRLTQDYVFSSPSTAAMVILGRTANGRIEWKNSAGTTLKDLQEATFEG